MRVSKAPMRWLVVVTDEQENNIAPKVATILFRSRAAAILFVIQYLEGDIELLLEGRISKKRRSY
jgi:hypothetical protein